jgi:hypothetical protein
MFPSYVFLPSPFLFFLPSVNMTIIYIKKMRKTSGSVLEVEVHEGQKTLAVNVKIC